MRLWTNTQKNRGQLNKLGKTRIYSSTKNTIFLRETTCPRRIWFFSPVYIASYILIRHVVYLVTGNSSILILCSSMVFAVRSRFISSRSSCPKVNCSNTKCSCSSTFRFGIPYNFGQNTMRLTIFQYGVQTSLIAVNIMC